MQQRKQRTVSRLIAVAVTILAMGVALAAAPGPKARGEFYYYFDANGNTIGYRAIRCDGSFTGWGKTSNSYSNGYAICLPIY